MEPVSHKPLELKSLDWFAFSRGQGVTCELIPEIPRSGEIPADVLKPGDEVKIDGDIWICKGIEYFMSNPVKVGNSLGMMVAKPEENDGSA